MKKHLLVFASFLLLSATAFAQDNFIKHTVEKGETVTKIAQKYKVTPANIYNLNPDSQNGLKPDMVLLIPKGNGAIIIEKPDATTKTHTVAAKETLYGLSKLYNVSVEEIEKANQSLKTEGLKVGSTIAIPVKKELATVPQLDKKQDKKQDKDSKNPSIHQVEAKETKYSIAKQYGISVEELENSNPEIKDGLQIGFRLKIPAGSKTIAKQEEKKVEIETKPQTKTVDVEKIGYVVQSKETLFGISKKLGISKENLIKLNPELENGLKEGMVLNLPDNERIANSDRAFADLTKTVNTANRKKLTLLLPFNISKIQSDTVNSTSSRLKKDKFLNMTLDFYSGALMAIDSAKILNLNVDVKIFDSQETKNSSSIATIIQQNNLQETDLVIGPFYQSNVEKTAGILSKNKVPVMSPLSKETGILYENLIQTMPSAEYMRDAMFDYMNSKAANIVGVIDPKKVSTKKYITENHKNVKFVSFDEKGNISLESLKSLLLKNQKNFVVLETANTYMIKIIMNTLVASMADYQIQLVILEPNEKLDSDEIVTANLAKLNLLYPSLARENDSPEAQIFEKKYKEVNKVFPNQYATRGFDITFDALLRLSQEQPFVETLETATTEQVENKFEYGKKDGKAYINDGFYILYFDTDLSVKVAN
ncbi:LysM repeat protein [Flavobacterium arsenatis]|uniref:LysM repeat protein n=1 Tax=Flavobacterium arsenatis TaxID=1484332 RepID=A0ABU1TRG0_9FLAO|nr:LysM peptidoglycan-binding domain-containing protein [Flavobacterium arsenatis]MDR6968442.1 LysM repeat protein [Flavobacterium arsenatis]